MQQVVVDCKTGKVTYTDLSLAEESQRLGEVEGECNRQAVEDKGMAKRQLVKALAELREMRQNRDIFDELDLVKMQAEVDRLSKKIKEYSKDATEQGGTVRLVRVAGDV